jgi:hypothetical protein
MFITHHQSATQHDCNEKQNFLDDLTALREVRVEGMFRSSSAKMNKSEGSLVYNAPVLVAINYQRETGANDTVPNDQEERRHSKEYEGRKVMFGRVGGACQISLRSQEVECRNEEKQGTKNCKDNAW